MNYLEEFEKRTDSLNRWDYILDIITLPVALPLFLIMKMFK